VGVTDGFGVGKPDGTRVGGDVGDVVGVLVGEVVGLLEPAYTANWQILPESPELPLKVAKPPQFRDKKFLTCIRL
jgi:hypothetical protein